MSIPAYILGFVVSTIYGSAFHLWKNGGLGKLLLYFVLSWTGFWLGHYIGDRVNWAIIGIGALNFGIASLGSILFLLIGDWLSQSSTS